MHSRKATVFYQFRRIISIFLAFSFTLFNTISNPYPLAAEPIPEPHLPNPESFSLPEEFGTIREKYIPEGERPNKLVIYLESAHRNLDSEKNTQKIIDYLEKEYGLNLILLEGGEGRLDTLFFKSFPDEKRKEKLLEHYLNQGDLSGAEVSSILEEGNRTQYYGIETQSIYDQNKDAFLNALRRQSEILERLKKRKAGLDQKSKKILPEKSIVFETNLEAFREERLDFLSYLKSLNALYPSPDRFEAKYPELQKLLSAEQNERTLEKDESLPFAMNRMIRGFQSRVGPKLSREDKLEVNGLIQDYRTSRTDGGMLIQKIRELSTQAGFEFNLPKVLQAPLSHSRMLLSVKGAAVFEELSVLERELRQILPVNEDERALLRDYEFFDLLNDFSKLELLPKDREQLKNTDLIDAELRPLFEYHFEFYELAEKRNEILAQNALKMIDQNHKSMALLSTGGFHTKGITEILKAEKIPFILISPAINHMTGKELYLNAMQGERSFMKYFKGSLWDALARDYASKIVFSLREEELGLSLKRWRDRIIQNSIAEGRITQAAQYTKYVDAIANTPRKEQKFEESLVKHKLDVFSSGLSDLWQRGGITPESVGDLIQRMNQAVLKSNIDVELALVRRGIPRAVNMLRGIQPAGKAKKRSEARWNDETSDFEEELYYSFDLAPTAENSRRLLMLNGKPLLYLRDDKEAPIRLFSPEGETDLGDEGEFSMHLFHPEDEPGFWGSEDLNQFLRTLAQAIRDLPHFDSKFVGKLADRVEVQLTYKPRFVYVAINGIERYSILRDDSNRVRIIDESLTRIDREYLRVVKTIAEAPLFLDDTLRPKITPLHQSDYFLFSPNKLRARSEARGERSKGPAPSEVAESYVKVGYFATLERFGISPRKYYQLITAHHPAPGSPSIDYFALSPEEAEFLVQNPKERKPFNTLTSSVTARNLILSALDTIPSFKQARESNNIKKIAALYRTHVIGYESKDKKKYSYGGQVSFFYEQGGLKGLMNYPRSYLAKTTSPPSSLRFALPGLIDLKNPDALDPLEVDGEYWTDPDNARYHIYEALDSIPGFKQAREANDIKKMAALYRTHVIGYEPKDKKKYSWGGQQSFFYERGGLAGLMGAPHPYLAKTGSPASLLRFALPGLVDDKNPDALQSSEVEHRSEARSEEEEIGRDYRRLIVENRLSELIRLVQEKKEKPFSDLKNGEGLKLLDLLQPISNPRLSDAVSLVETFQLSNRSRKALRAILQTLDSIRAVQSAPQSFSLQGLISVRTQREIRKSVEDSLLGASYAHDKVHARGRLSKLVLERLVFAISVFQEQIDSVPPWMKDEALMKDAFVFLNQLKSRAVGFMRSESVKRARELVQPEAQSQFPADSDQTDGIRVTSGEIANEINAVLKMIYEVGLNQRFEIPIVDFLNDAKKQLLGKTPSVEKASLLINQAMEMFLRESVDSPAYREAAFGIQVLDLIARERNFLGIALALISWLDNTLDKYGRIGADLHSKIRSKLERAKEYAGSEIEQDEWLFDEDEPFLDEKEELSDYDKRREVMAIVKEIKGDIRRMLIDHFFPQGYTELQIEEALATDGRLEFDWGLHRGQLLHKAWRIFHQIGREDMREDRRLRRTRRNGGESRARSEVRGKSSEYYESLLPKNIFPDDKTRYILGIRIAVQAREHPEAFEENSIEDIVRDIEDYGREIRELGDRPYANDLWKEFGSVLEAETSSRRNDGFGFLSDSGYRILEGKDSQLRRQARSDRIYGTRKRGVTLKKGEIALIIDVLSQGYANQAIGKPVWPDPRASVFKRSFKVKVRLARLHRSEARQAPAKKWTKVYEALIRAWTLFNHASPPDANPAYDATEKELAARHGYRILPAIYQGLVFQDKNPNQLQQKINWVFDELTADMVLIREAYDQTVPKREAMALLRELTSKTYGKGYELVLADRGPGFADEDGDGMPDLLRLVQFEEGYKGSRGHHQGTSYSIQKVDEIEIVSNGWRWEKGKQPFHIHEDLGREAGSGKKIFRPLHWVGTQKNLSRVKNAPAGTFIVLRVWEHFPAYPPSTLPDLDDWFQELQQHARSETRDSEIAQKVDWANFYLEYASKSSQELGEKDRERLSSVLTKIRNTLSTLPSTGFSVWLFRFWVHFFPSQTLKNLDSAISDLKKLVESAGPGLYDDFDSSPKDAGQPTDAIRDMEGLLGALNEIRALISRSEARQRQWSTQAEGISTVTKAIEKHRPDILERYSHLKELNSDAIEALREEVYQLKRGHFKIWDISPAMDRRTSPYFEGSHVHALIAVFPNLELNPLGFFLGWSTKNKGIQSARYVFSKQIPSIMRRYELIDRLSEYEIQMLKKEVYQLTQLHLRVWGLSAALNSKLAPYFKGDFIFILKTVFPKLKLDDLGFGLDWSTKESGIESIKYIMSKQVPSIMKRYQKLNRLTKSEIQQLKDEIYSIEYSHFRVWGILAAASSRNASYFNGNYISALMSVFPKLDLNPLGFRLDWSTKERGIASIKYVLSREEPAIMERYNNIDFLTQEDIEALKKDIYAITNGHFEVWGLGAAINIRQAPYFNGSYMGALGRVFDHPKLGFSETEMRRFRGSHYAILYHWEDRDQSIQNIRDAVGRHRPDLIRQYNNLTNITADEFTALQQEFYRITGSHFDIWRIGRALNVPYFNKLYMDALIASFPELKLNRLGFKLDWSSRDAAIESIRYILNRKVPGIMERYQHLDSLREEEVQALRKEIYGISFNHFAIWGLGSIGSRRFVPYFKGSHFNALIAVFPKLDLNPLGFRPDISSKEQAIESIRFALMEQRPTIMERYQKLGRLTKEQVSALKSEIYAIKSDHLRFWEVRTPTDPKRQPYFNSYIEALMSVFPKLDLNPLGFRLDWSTKERGIASIKYVLSREEPAIMERYSKLDSLTQEDIETLKKDIYAITSGHFEVWGLGAAVNIKTVPYFNGSYIRILLGIFSDSRLGLEKDGFSRSEARSGSAQPGDEIDFEVRNGISFAGRINLWLNRYKKIHAVEFDIGGRHGRIDLTSETVDLSTHLSLGSELFLNPKAAPLRTLLVAVFDAKQILVIGLTHEAGDKRIIRIRSADSASRLDAVESAAPAPREDPKTANPYASPGPYEDDVSEDVTPEQVPVETWDWHTAPVSARLKKLTGYSYRQLPKNKSIVIPERFFQAGGRPISIYLGEEGEHVEIWLSQWGWRKTFKLEDIGDKKYTLRVGRGILIGRKTDEKILPPFSSDKRLFIPTGPLSSVSRFHLRVQYVRDKQGRSLVLTDVNSRFGSWILENDLLRFTQARSEARKSSLFGTVKPWIKKHPIITIVLAWTALGIGQLIVSWSRGQKKEDIERALPSQVVQPELPVGQTPPAKESVPWKQEINPDMESAKKFIQGTIDWLIEKDYPHPQILRNYKKAVQNAKHMPPQAEMVGMMGKKIAPEGETSIILSPTMIYDSAAIFKRLDEPNIFFEGFAILVIREAWGAEYLRWNHSKVSNAQNWALRTFREEKQELNLQLAWPDAATSRFLSKWESEIVEHTSVLLEGEIIEAKHQREARVWGEKTGLFSVNELERFLKQHKGETFEHGKLKFYPERPLASKLSGELFELVEHNLQHPATAMFSIFLHPPRMPEKIAPNIYGYYFLLEFYRYKDSAGKEGLNPNTLIPVVQKGEFPPREDYRSSAERLLPYIEKLMSEWKKHIARSEARGKKREEEKRSGRRNFLYRAGIIASAISLAGIGSWFVWKHSKKLTPRENGGQLQDDSRDASMQKRLLKDVIEKYKHERSQGVDDAKIIQELFEEARKIHPPPVFEHDKGLSRLEVLRGQNGRTVHMVAERHGDPHSLELLQQFISAELLHGDELETKGWAFSVENEDQYRLASYFFGFPGQVEYIVSEVFNVPRVSLIKNHFQWEVVQRMVDRALYARSDILGFLNYDVYLSWGDSISDPEQRLKQAALVLLVSWSQDLKMEDDQMQKMVQEMLNSSVHIAKTAQSPETLKKLEGIKSLLREVSFELTRDTTQHVLSALAPEISHVFLIGGRTHLGDIKAGAENWLGLSRSEARALEKSSKLFDSETGVSYERAESTSIKNPVIGNGQMDAASFLRQDDVGTRPPKDPSRFLEGTDSIKAGDDGKLGHLDSDLGNLGRGFQPFASGVLIPNGQAGLNRLPNVFPDRRERVSLTDAAGNGGTFGHKSEIFSTTNQNGKAHLISPFPKDNRQNQRGQGLPLTRRSEARERKQIERSMTIQPGTHVWLKGKTGVYVSGNLKGRTDVQDPYAKIEFFDERGNRKPTQTIREFSIFGAGGPLFLASTEDIKGIGKAKAEAVAPLLEENASQTKHQNTRQHALDVIAAFFAKRPAEVNGRTRLKRIGASPLVLVELQIEVEDEFDISIPDREAARWKTAGDVVRSINKLVNNRSEARDEYRKTVERRYAELNRKLRALERRALKTKGRIGDDASARTNPEVLDAYREELKGYEKEINDFVSSISDEYLISQYGNALKGLVVIISMDIHDLKKQAYHGPQDPDHGSDTPRSEARDISVKEEAPNRVAFYDGEQKLHTLKVRTMSNAGWEDATTTAGKLITRVNGLVGDRSIVKVEDFGDNTYALHLADNHRIIVSEFGAIDSPPRSEMRESETGEISIRELNQWVLKNQIGDLVEWLETPDISEEERKERAKRYYFLAGDNLHHGAVRSVVAQIIGKDYSRRLTEEVLETYVRAIRNNTTIPGVLEFRGRRMLVHVPEIDEQRRPHFSGEFMKFFGFQGGRYFIHAFDKHEDVFKESLKKTAWLKSFLIYTIVPEMRKLNQQNPLRSEARTRSGLQQFQEIGNGDFGVAQNAAESTPVQFPVIGNDQNLSRNSVAKFDMTSALTDGQIAGSPERFDQLTAGDPRKFHAEGEFLNSDVKNVAAFPRADVLDIGREVKMDGLTDVAEGLAPSPALRPTPFKGRNGSNDVTVLTPPQNNLKFHRALPFVVTESNSTPPLDLSQPSTDSRLLRDVSARSEAREEPNPSESWEKFAAELKEQIKSIEATAQNVLGHDFSIQYSGYRFDADHEPRYSLSGLLVKFNLKSLIRNFKSRYGDVTIPKEITRLDQPYSELVLEDIKPDIEINEGKTDIQFRRYRPLKFGQERIPLTGILFFYEDSESKIHQFEHVAGEIINIPTDVPIWSLPNGVLAVNLTVDHLGGQELENAILKTLRLPVRSEAREEPQEPENNARLADKKIIKLSKDIKQLIMAKAGPPRSDFQKFGNMIRAYRLTLKLLIQIGALPNSPRQGKVVSVLHGLDPLLWEQVSGVEIDGGFPSTRHVLDHWVERFGLSKKETFRNGLRGRNLHIIPALDFNDTGRIKEILSELPFGIPKYHILKHSESFYKDKVGYPGNIDFNGAFGKYLEEVVAEGSTIVLIQDEHDEYHLNASKILEEHGYRDVLPELLPKEALDNIRETENVVAMMGLGVAWWIGGSLKVFRKVPPAGARPANEDQNFRSEARVNEERMTGLLRKAIVGKDKNGTLIRWTDVNGVYVDQAYVDAHREEFVEGILNLDKAYQTRYGGVSFLELGAGYLEMSGLPGYHLEQAYTQALIAVGKALGFWEVYPDFDTGETAPDSAFRIGLAPAIQSANREVFGRSEARQWSVDMLNGLRSVAQKFITEDSIFRGFVLLRLPHLSGALVVSLILEQGNALGYPPEFSPIIRAIRREAIKHGFEGNPVMPFILEDEGAQALFATMFLTAPEHMEENVSVLNWPGDDPSIALTDRFTVISDTPENEADLLKTVTAAIRSEVRNLESVDRSARESLRTDPNDNNARAEARAKKKDTQSNFEIVKNVSFMGRADGKNDYDTLVFLGGKLGKQEIEVSVRGGLKSAIYMSAPQEFFMRATHPSWSGSYFPNQIHFGLSDAKQYPVEIVSHESGQVLIKLQFSNQYFRGRTRNTNRIILDVQRLHGIQYRIDRYKTQIQKFTGDIRSEVREEQTQKDARSIALTPIQVAKIALPKQFEQGTNLVTERLGQVQLLKVINQEHVFFDSERKQRVIYVGGHCNACIDTSLQATALVADSNGLELQILIPLDLVYIGAEDFNGEIDEATRLKRLYASQLFDQLSVKLKQANLQIWWDDEKIGEKIFDAAEPVTINVNFYHNQFYMLEKILNLPSKRSEARILNNEQVVFESQPDKFSLRDIDGLQEDDTIYAGPVSITDLTSSHPKWERVFDVYSFQDRLKTPGIHNVIPEILLNSLNGGGNGEVLADFSSSTHAGINGNSGRVFKLRVTQTESRQEDWDEIQNIHKGFVREGSSYLINRISRSGGEGGGGFKQVGIMFNGSPAILRYLRNKEKSHTLVTEFYVLFPLNGAVHHTASRSEARGSERILTLLMREAVTPRKASIILAMAALLEVLDDLGLSERTLLSTAQDQFLKKHRDEIERTLTKYNDIHYDPDGPSFWLFVVFPSLMAPVHRKLFEDLFKKAADENAHIFTAEGHFFDELAPLIVSRFDEMAVEFIKNRIADPNREALAQALSTISVEARKAITLRSEAREEDLVGVFERSEALAKNFKVFFSREGWKNRFDALNILLGRESREDRFDTLNIFFGRKGGKYRLDYRNVRFDSSQSFLDAFQFVLDIPKAFAKYAKLALQVFQYYRELALTRIIRVFSRGSHHDSQPTFFSRVERRLSNAGKVERTTFPRESTFTSRVVNRSSTADKRSGSGATTSATVRNSLRRFSINTATSRAEKLSSINRNVTVSHPEDFVNIKNNKNKIILSAYKKHVLFAFNWDNVVGGQVPRLGEYEVGLMGTISPRLTAGMIRRQLMKELKQRAGNVWEVTPPASFSEEDVNRARHLFNGIVAGIDEPTVIQHEFSRSELRLMKNPEEVISREIQVALGTALKNHYVMARIIAPPEFLKSISIKLNDEDSVRILASKGKMFIANNTLPAYWSFAGSPAAVRITTNIAEASQDRVFDSGRYDDGSHVVYDNPEIAAQMFTAVLLPPETNEYQVQRGKLTRARSEARLTASTTLVIQMLLEAQTRLVTAQAA